MPFNLFFLLFIAWKSSFSLPDSNSYVYDSNILSCATFQDSLLAPSIETRYSPFLTREVSSWLLFYLWAFLLASLLFSLFLRLEIFFCYFYSAFKEPFLWSEMGICNPVYSFSKLFIFIKLKGNLTTGFFFGNFFSEFLHWDSQIAEFKPLELCSAVLRAR